MSELRALSPAFRTLSALLGAGAAIGFISGCVIVNTEHCGYKANGAANPCPEGFVCSVCAVENNGCVSLDQKDSIKESCLDGQGTIASTPTDPTDPTEPMVTASSGTTTTTEPSTGTTTSDTTTMAVTETTSTDTTDTSTTVPPVDCDPQNVSDQACSPYYCLPNGKCGECGKLPGEGLSCEGLFPDKPICDDQKGVCAQCSGDDTSECPAAAPACDSETGTCVKCTEHFQCPAACDIETGMCFPEQERVYYVRGEVGKCPGTGTADDPFCDLNLVPIEPGQPTTIKVMAGLSPPGALAVPEGGVVAVVREGAQVPDLNGTGNFSPTLQVTGASSRVYVSRLRFRFAPNSVIRCQNGATLWIHETTIEGNGMQTARAIDSTSCALRVVRSVIKNCGAGVQVTSGDFRFESSFAFGNGNNLTFGAFNFVSKPTVRIAYSSILQNKQTNTTTTFTCPGVMPMDPWDIKVRNSAVLGRTPMESAGCVTYEGGLQHAAVDLNDETAMAAMWFTPNPDGLFSPKAGGPLDGQATWSEGDPSLDYNRQPIPQAGTSWAGAIQPP